MLNYTLNPFCMKIFSLLNCLILFSISVGIQAQEATLREDGIWFIKDFQSEYVIPRNVEIMLPDGYEEDTDKRYQVLYMHDGQNVFNSKTAYTGVDWGVDEILDSLIKVGKINETIIVAPWNSYEKRFSEYMPKAPAMMTDNPMVKEKLKETTGFDDLYSDQYLKFIVEELKPFIDSKYRTKSGLEHTAIMGSSMGGLISLYAICKYPDVFSGAGCVSTHWPVPVLGDAYISTLSSSLPNPENHTIYFDYGTEGLDKDYEPYQMQVDSIMMEKGFVKNDTWTTLKFEGAGHNEQSWNERVHIILEFILD